MKVDNLMDLDKRYPQMAGTANPEKMLLFSLLRHIGAKKVLEVGVSAGHMTCWLAQAMKYENGYLTSVDNFSRAHGGQASSKEIPQKRINIAGLKDWVTLIKSDSVEFMKNQPDDTYDFVWVDADHSFKGAYDDIVEALRISKNGIGVHDVYQQYDGPREACLSIEHDMGISGTWIPGFRGTWLYFPRPTSKEE